MTGLQLALAGGALIGLGSALAIWRLLPADPDLADALERLSPAHARRATTAAGTATPADTKSRLGVWAIKHLPRDTWWRTPTKELALLRIPPERFYGEKILYAAVGLLIPPVLAALLSVLDLGVPVLVPAAGSIALAGVTFFIPDIDARAAAVKARAEFSRALGAYIDLVALERLSGSGPRQAMETAAQVGHSWVFQRLGEELARSRWSGVPPWDALHTLAAELGLPALDDLADIMRLSGEEGAQIYTNLRARSAGMRDAMLNDERAKANAISERMSIPMSLLGVVFLVILVAPALLRVFTSS